MYTLDKRDVVCGRITPSGPQATPFWAANTASSAKFVSFMLVFVFVFLSGTNPWLSKYNYISLTTACSNLDEFQTRIVSQCGTQFSEVSSKLARKRGCLRKYDIML